VKRFQFILLLILSSLSCKDKLPSVDISAHGFKSSHLLDKCEVCVGIRDAYNSRKWVTHLIINSGNYKVLPDSIIEFTRLQSLTIQQQDSLDWKNSFDKISKIKTLKNLELDYYPTNKFPNNYCTIERLETLTVNFVNGYTGRLEVNLCSSQLNYLSVTGQIDRAIIGLKSLKNLKSLKLSGTNISEFPVEIYSLNNLEFLHLSDTKIDNISMDITNLKQLKELFLDNTPIGDREKKYFEKNKKFNELEFIIKSLPKCRIKVDRYPEGL